MFKIEFKEDKLCYILKRKGKVIIIHDILSYMKSRHKDDSKKQTDIEIEKKTADGEYKIIFKSSEVEDIDKAVAKTIQQIKKL